MTGRNRVYKFFAAPFARGRHGRTRSVCLGMVSVLCAALLCPAHVFAAEEQELKSVKVAVEDSGIFFKSDSTGKLVSGYGYEFIQSIAAYANWNVEYVLGGAFSDCLEMVRDGSADIFYDVSYTEERGEWLLYAEEPMGSEDYYLFCLADNKELRADDFSTYAGKRAGVTAGTIEGEELRLWCEQKGVELEIVEYESDPAKEAALESGEVELDYEINLLAKPDYAALTKVSGSDYYMVSGLGREDLIHDINDAYQKIMAVDSSFFERLANRYFAGSVLNRTLSADEQRWVDSHDTLRVGFMDNYMPFSDETVAGKPDGIVKDIVPQMLDSIGLSDELPVEYVAYENNEQMFSALRSGEIDIVFPVIDSMDMGMKHELLISSDIISLSADLVFMGGYSEETTACIAVNRNNELQDFYTRATYPAAEILYCDTAEDCLTAVTEGAAGATILNGLRTASLLASDDYDNLKQLRLSEPYSFSFAVGRGNSSLLSICNRAIACMDSGFAYNSAFGYIGIEEPLTLRGYIKTHKVLFLTASVFVLCVVLCAAVVMMLAQRRSAKKMAEANNAKTSFLFNMSHDIRTPMNAIIGFNNMARCNLDNREKLVDCLDKTQQASNLLLALINSILEMSRIESGKAELEEKPGDIRLSFENFRSTVQALAEDKNIDLSFSFGEITDYYVFADFERVVRVFINIVTNSIKYTNNGGWIRVKCEQIGRRGECGLYRYTFADNGIGMSEEFQKHLFDEFAREKSSTASGVQGSGLGLSVVRSFVELLKGTIECSSQQGIGTTFTVTLPFRLQTDPESAQYTDPSTHEPRAVNAESEEKTVDLSGLRILLVEDNEMNREIASFILTEQGLIVEEADDGTVAVELLREKGPDYYDFVLMDIQMPIMDGYDATRAIRSMYPDAKLPIIALSANAFAEDRASSVEAGMNDHIAKPINNAELIRVLTNYLR